jgi:NAD(P)-dependent dehydrogenase (short-subunit alcohol dehydrogenase family)/rhamnose utilization protein RhaD (predicted bifunctional aldolase and dehydrogenase)
MEFPTLAEKPSTVEQVVTIAEGIAQDSTLFLEGLSSISIKKKGKTHFGREEQLLWINYAGAKWAGIVGDDFIGLRTRPLLEIVEGVVFTNKQTASALIYSRIDHKSAHPPLDALLHVVIPYSIVLFTQPIGVQAIASTSSGSQRLEDIYGDLAAIIPYETSMFRTASACQDVIRSKAVACIILENRGVMTFGNSPQEAITTLETVVERAGMVPVEDRHFGRQCKAIKENIDRQKITELRQLLSQLAGVPLLVRDVTISVESYIESAGGIEEVSKYWPAYPELFPHFNGPLVYLRTLEEFRKVFDEKISVRFGVKGKERVRIPHIILTQEGEVYLVARTSKDLEDIQARFQHHLLVLARALNIEKYISPSEHLFFDLDSYKPEMYMEKASKYSFQGEVALVTGGASGIGKACVESLLGLGAAVVALDINPSITGLYASPNYLGLQCDLTDEEGIKVAFNRAVSHFGGIDMLVLNAGIFPSGCRIENLSMEEWHKVLRINLDSNLSVLIEAHPLLKTALKYGRVVINGSKNVKAPGNGAVAYSSSKAALTQMARVAALEWGKDGIRVNVIHPDAVFDTGIWTEDVLKARATHYGLTVQQYKTRNILGVEITSRDIAGMISEMLGPLFEKITGTQVNMDGGNDRII